MKISDFEIFKTNKYSKFINNEKEYLINQEPYLDIVLTDFCNANCGFCIADLIHTKLKLDFEVMKEKVLFALDNMNVKEVLLLGGEPTISKNLIPTIEWLKSLNRLNKICMTTNGILLSKNYGFLDDVFSSGLTNCNISFMNYKEDKQKEITNKCSIGLEGLNKIKYVADKYDVKIRINNNIFKNNNDTLDKVIDFFRIVRNFCNSVKFSPLLKVDSFSVLDIKTKWVNENILSDDEYDKLFDEIEKHYINLHDISIIENNEQFGFVKNTLIPLDVPIILNYNQHGQMMNKVINENKINNIKLLPNNELSLSWNRELKNYFIKTN